jgi:hypothetical protein
MNTMRSALTDLLNRYVTLIDSGDCGFWNPEEESVVIAARAALNEATALDGIIITETWQARVTRRFGALLDERPFNPKFSDEQNRTLILSDAQFQADKEMLNEIHLMLRMLLRRKSVR